MNGNDITTNGTMANGDERTIIPSLSSLSLSLSRRAKPSLLLSFPIHVLTTILFIAGGTSVINLFENV